MAYSYANSYANSNNRKIGVSGPPVFGVDDLLSDELPDYSSRRSSYCSPHSVGQKTTSFDEPDRNRKISTASTMLEVPGSTSLGRQNSLTSTASLVSNSSVRTFSYENFRRPKVRNTLGGVVILIGLCLLVIGICLLIFGDTTSPTFNQGLPTNNTSNLGPNLNQDEPHASAVKTVGYFALFSGVLIILVGTSTICCIHVEKKVNPQQDRKLEDRKLERRVSTIIVEPPLNAVETAINKPEIMITTDSLRGDTSFRKFPTPNFMARAKLSIDESTDPNLSSEIQRRFPF